MAASYTITIPEATQLYENRDYNGEMWVSFRMEDGGVTYRLPVESVRIEKNKPAWVHGGVYKDDRDGAFWQYVDPELDGKHGDPYFLTFGDSHSHSEELGDSDHLHLVE